jgi:hypothetical protein
MVNYYEFQCPHCNVTIQVAHNQVNCKIFRCGVYKGNDQPIPPHSSKQECDRLVQNNLINGCGKPFKFDGKNVTICGYI